MTDDTDNATDLGDFKTRGTDRPRGILTKNDRQLLRGDSSYENEQQIRDARYRMRKRVKESFLDLQDLQEHYPIEEYEQVIESIRNEFTAYEMRNVAGAAIETAVIIAKIGIENGYITGSGGESITFEGFLEEKLKGIIIAVEGISAEQTTIPEVDVDIDVTHRSFDEEHLLTKFVYGNPMDVPKADVLAYLTYGDLDRLERRLREEDTVLYYRDDDITIPIEPGSAVFDPEKWSVFDPIIGNRQNRETDEDDSE